MPLIAHSIDCGHPAPVSRVTPAMVSATRGRSLQVAEMFRYYAGWPTKIHGATNPIDASRLQYMLREPM